MMDINVSGLTSKFAVGEGRASTDRQFFYVNGRPCDAPKVFQLDFLINGGWMTFDPQIQKAYNEVYRSFNATQSPFVVVDFQIPTGAFGYCLQRRMCLIVLGRCMRHQR